MLESLVYDLRVIIALGSFLILACATYVAWPGRWNIPAHMAVGFFIVAFLVPVGLLNGLDKYDRDLVVLFLTVMGTGSIFFLFGVAVGAKLVNSDLVRSRLAWMTRSDPAARNAVAARAGVVAMAGVAAVLFSIAVMGFVPMFAEDPFAAKFFRGEYGDAYRPVAPFFRAGTAIIETLVPVMAGYAFWRSGFFWKIAVVVSLGIMVVSLQRGPGFTGLLVLLGVLLAAKRHTILFVFAIVLSYVFATLYYFFLGLFGVGSLGSSPIASSGDSFLESIAKTAPDVADNLDFLRRWSVDEPLTLGQTFWGGLVPGQFPSNPSVWTLTLGDPGIDVTQIVTGGLRLPLPIWGLVSFGAVGVVVVPLVSGLLAGYLARCAHAVMSGPMQTLERIWLLVAYITIGGVTADFYTLGYMGVVQVIVVLWILSAARRTPAASQIGEAFTGAAPALRRSRTAV